MSFWIRADKFANWILGGYRDETISSRLARARDKGSKIGKVGCRLLSIPDPGHCDTSKHPEFEGKPGEHGKPPENRESGIIEAP